jgi:hypothetical protein
MTPPTGKMVSLDAVRPGSAENQEAKQRANSIAENAPKLISIATVAHKSDLFMIPAIFG